MTAEVITHPAALLGGRYALGRLISAGGTARVYEAENIFVGKRVAVKLLNDSLARHVQVRRRFVAEARAAAQLNHPNVVDIHDVGDDHGGLYIVMELLQGETLGEIIAARGALPVPYACELVLQVLTALGAAHRQGIVHRDLKPENVMVTHPRPDQPLVKVLDFGIAQGIAGSTPDPEGVLIGTPAYMAPEQALGRRVDARADLYACGVLLYEVLAGQAPFHGKSAMQIMGAVLQGRYTPLSRLAPQLPAELTSLVAALLQPAVEDRPASASEVADVLSRYAGVELENEPEPIPLCNSRPSLRFPSRLDDSAPILHQDLGIAELSDPQIPRSRSLALDAESWGLPAGTAMPLESEILARRADTSPPSGGDRYEDSNTPPRSYAPRAPLWLAVVTGFAAGLVSMWAGGLL
ncbi:MAG: serine/threonine-protein kinase [Polyangiaceae bacterium]